MIEVCPRCSSRLGNPLRSGRQVCPSCGWASEPLPAKPPPPPKQPAAIVVLLQTGWRIVQRVFTYLGQWIRVRLGQWQAARSASQPGGKRSLVAGLNERLSSLEQAIPTDVSAESRPWMTPEEAFFHLGGNLDNPASAVRSSDGSMVVTLRRFTLLSREVEFRALGLEANLARRDANKPWLRRLPD